MPQDGREMAHLYCLIRFVKLSMLCRTYFGQAGSGYCHKAATDMPQKRDTLIKGGMVLRGPTVGPLEASSCSSGKLRAVAVAQPLGHLASCPECELKVYQAGL